MFASLAHAALALHMVVTGDATSTLVERWRPADPKGRYPAL